jgi:thiosulfate/3-mercaptopyruvate sulfurtransferase
MSHHGYATEDALVDSEWALAHLTDPNVRFVEVDVDTTAYEQSHIPGAVGWNWTSQLADGIRRDIAGREDFSALLSASGIGPDTTIVLYGDNNNWFAAWAYWQLKLYGHRDIRILNGGRKYWLDHGLALSVDEPSYPATGYDLPEPDFSLRAFRDDILPRLGDPELALVDVRSPAEYNGEIIAPPGMSETAQRAGHIPGAASIPWAQTVKEDGTFKSAEDLATLYEAKGITPDKDVIA